MDTQIEIPDNQPIPESPESRAGERLRSFIERVERLEEEKKAIADDIKEIYAEAKSQGFDSKILRRVVSLRKKDAELVRLEEELLDTYRKKLGMR